MVRPRAIPSPPDPTAGLAFLLSQVGAHSSARFADRLEPLGFKPAHAGILGIIRDADGLSQQALAERLGMFPSRLVALIDEMEGKGLLERRNSPADRRTYALFLTESGRDALEQIGKISQEHQATICATLSQAERSVLAEMLRRIATEQGLAPGVHPGFSRMDSGKAKS